MVPSLFPHTAARSPLRPLGWAAVCLALLGCQHQDIHDRANERMAEVHGDVSRAVVWTTCPDPGRPLGPGCGLLAEGLRSEAFLQKFERAHCRERTTEACQELHARFYAARLKDRYHAADLAAVEHQCDLEPGRCDDPVGYEKLLMRSHNAHIHERAATRGRRVEEERLQELQRASEDDERLLGRVISLADRPVSGGHRREVRRSAPADPPRSAR